MCRHAWPTHLVYKGFGVGFWRCPPLPAPLSSQSRPCQARIACPAVKQDAQVWLYLPGMPDSVTCCRSFSVSVSQEAHEGAFLRGCKAARHQFTVLPQWHQGHSCGLSLQPWVLFSRLMCPGLTLQWTDTGSLLGCLILGCLEAIQLGRLRRGGRSGGTSCWTQTALPARGTTPHQATTSSTRCSQELDCLKLRL